ncbi:MAG: hypothetical protein JXA08_04485 [Methanomicrobiaceae archaeon]|nr:hypothetical protein [Methanomicrobiaceae archaeon]
MALNSDQIFYFRQNLFRELRNELGHLKTCQTALVVLSITGSGVYLGLISTIGLSYLLPYLLLIPLLILLPLWIIFYDKARTIARIIGFLRVQETLAKENSEIGLIGWESAMKEYWTVRDKYDELHYDDVFESAKKLQKDNDQQSKIRESIINSTYWSTVYALFFFFSIICLGMSFYLLKLDETIKLILFFWFLFTWIINFIGVKCKPIHKYFNKRIYYFKNGTNDYPHYIHQHRRFYTILWNVWILTIICDCVAILYIINSNQNLINQIPNVYHIVFRNPDLVVPFSSDIISIVIFMIFGSVFISTSMIVFWMLSGLIKGFDGRYSYNSFQLRWEIALLGKPFVYSKYVKKPSLLLAKSDILGGYKNTVLYKTVRNTYFKSCFAGWMPGNEKIKILEKDEAILLYNCMEEKLVEYKEAFPDDL